MRYIFLIAVSLALILAIVVAGIVLGPGRAQENNQTAAQQVNAEYLISTQNSAPLEFYTLGDNFSQAILLEMDKAQFQDQPADYTLLVDPIGSDLLLGTDTNYGICADSGTAVASPPPGVMATIHDLPNQAPYWQQISQWLQDPLSNNYIITLWSPENQSESYKLVSGEATGFNTETCHLADEDV